MPNKIGHFIFNCGLLRIYELHHVLVFYLTLYQFVHLRSEIAWYVCYCVEEVFEAFWPFLYGLQSLHCGYDAGSMMMMMFAACAEYSVWIILRTRLILVLLKRIQSKSHQKKSDSATVPQHMQQTSSSSLSLRGI